MHNYINFAKNYLKERGCEIDENFNKNKDIFIFKFKCNNTFFLFVLNDLFPHSLPLIKTENTSIEFPHFIEGTNLTSLCLGYEEDFNLYGSDPKIIISETLDKFFKLLSLSPGQQKKEFFKEFLHFWHKKTDINKTVKLYIKPKQIAEEISINETLTYDKSKKIAKKKTRLAYSKDIFINSFNFKSGTTINGIYIPLVNLSALSPFPENWDIRELLNTNISSESYNFLKNYFIDKNYTWIIFSMKLKNNFEIMFTAEIKFKSKEKSTLLEKLYYDIKEIIPHFSKRYDIDYLCQRTSGNLNGINKNVSLIGCGSLGSYIATELCKLGIAKLNLFDPDILMPENIFRHSLGTLYIGTNKASGLKLNLELNYSQIQVNSYSKEINFNNILENKFEESDLIIFAIGNTTSQLLINDVLAENKFTKPVLYTWLDSFGTGCHALFIDYSKKGCYKCLSLAENGEISEKSKTTFSENSDDIIYGDGCGGTFTPYGNIILLKGTSMIIKIILDFFNGKTYDKNLFFSIKNYFQENIQYTERYLDNKTDFLENDDFIIDGCDTCGK